MSRTRRTKHRRCWLRTPKTKGVQTAELYAAQEIEEAGFAPPPRQAARANPKSRKIANAWDDKRIAADNEQDHHRRES